MFRMMIWGDVMCHIRIAEKNDVDVLNKIAYESEAYWGYDPGADHPCSAAIHRK